MQSYARLLRTDDSTVPGIKLVLLPHSSVVPQHSPPLHTPLFHSSIVSALIKEHTYMEESTVYGGDGPLY